MLEPVERLRREILRSQLLMEESRRLLARSHDLFDARNDPYAVTEPEAVPASLRGESRAAISRQIG